MNLKFFSLILSFVIYSCFQTANAQNKANLFVVDQEIEADSLADQFTISKEQADLKVFPKKEIIDAFLENEEFARDWDELEKDIFYMNLKTRKMDYLKKKYPHISSEKLRELKSKF